MLSVPPVGLAIREHGSAVRRRCLIYRGFHRTAACDFAVDIGICRVKTCASVKHDCVVSCETFRVKHGCRLWVDGLDGAGLSPESDENGPILSENGDVGWDWVWVGVGLPRNRTGIGQKWAGFV